MTEKMLRDFCDFGLDTGLFDTLKKTLANYNPTANNTIVGIMQSSIFGVGASMLTLFMLLELVSLINRVDSGQGLNGTKIPANALIKFAVLSLFYCNIPAVINGIEAVGVYIASSLFWTSCAEQFSAAVWDFLLLHWQAFQKEIAPKNKINVQFLRCTSLRKEADLII